MLIYVIADTTELHSVNNLTNAIRAKGHDLTYDWSTELNTVHESRFRTMARELHRNGIKIADAIIALDQGSDFTSGKIAYAIALNKKILVVSSDHRWSNCVIYFTNITSAVEHLDISI